MVIKLKKRIKFTKEIIVDDNSRINFLDLFLADSGLSFTEPLIFDEDANNIRIAPEYIIDN